jgi:hypothetical protein
MDARLVDATLKFHIAEMSERLDRAAGIARAAQTCAEAVSTKLSRLRSTSSS